MNFYAVVVDSNYPYVFKAPSASGRNKENGATTYVCAMKVIDDSFFKENEKFNNDVSLINMNIAFNKQLCK